MWLYIKKAASIVLMSNLFINTQSIFPKSKNEIKSDSLNSEKTAIYKKASYVGEFAGNLSGGKRKGTAYLGMANLKIGFETDNVGLWRNGEFFIKGVSTHGAVPSEKLFGEFQVASNIEAGNNIYIQELWYKHNFGTSELTVGLQDLNAEFITCCFSENFINSSFGIPSLIAENIPAPIFPLTALGITGKINLSEKVVLKSALFDGLPEEFENNKYNLNWQLSSRNGILLFTELQLSTNLNELPGSIKAGTYYHTHLSVTVEPNGSTITAFDKNYGFYLIADQTLLQKSDNNKIGFFAQLALSPRNINMHNYYIGGGISCTGILGNECDNSIGLGIAHAGLNSSALKSETVIEVFYKSTLQGNF
ncbi:MAG: carbohydrate porin, partial [Bacteroidota bacterium]